MKNVSSGSRITWPTSPQKWQVGFEKPFGSLDEYYAWLKNNEYSAILFDGSMLQISFDFQLSDLVSYRMVYYPCPIELTLQEQMLLREFPVFEVIDAYSEAKERFRAKSPIRFEFDLESATSTHPASHMTMLTNNCRVPVYGPLSLGHFVSFVFRNFYPDIFDRHRFVRDWPTRIGPRTLEMSDQRSLMYLNFGN